MIVAYNMRRLLEPVLLALRHQILRSDDEYEVIVVDDGSDDGTGDMVRRAGDALPLRYRYLGRRPSSSRSRARNVGASLATGEILIFLDGDQIVSPNYVASHLDRHRHANGLAVIGIRVRLSEGEVDTAALEKRFDVSALPPIDRDDVRLNIAARYSENAGDYAGAWHLFHSCNVSLPKSLFTAVGSFDESFHGWGLEDCELGFRLWRSGVRFVLSCEQNSFDQCHSSSLDEATYRSWRINLNRFRDKHECWEVYCQDVFDGAFNPDVLHSWLDCYFRFEDASRLLSRRRPRAPEAVIVEVRRELQREDVLNLLQEHGERTIVIADEQGSICNQVAVQSTAVAQGLLYFAVNAPPHRTYNPRDAFFNAVVSVSDGAPRSVFLQ